MLQAFLSGNEKRLHLSAAFFKTNPLWVSGEVLTITSWNQLASPRGFEPLSTA